MQPVNHNLQNPELNGCSFLLNGSSTGVLLFHGFTATTLEVRGLADFIHTQTGFTVMGPLLPGHGTSPEDLSKVQYKEWMDSAEMAFSTLQTNCKTILVGGESMGGLLALFLAARHPEIKGVLLFAPALIIPGLWGSRLLKWFIFASKKKNLNTEKDGVLPWQGYKVNPLKAVVELGKLQSEVGKIISKVIQPVIIFQGTSDETIDRRSSTIILENISSLNKELIEVNNCGHCVLLDSAYRSIYKQSLKFIQNNLISNPAFSSLENH
jgi:carboxylesterase